ncbi:MAG: 5-amino-6-(D-ribitylamino)uracil--L-tyrosine 4-hydroxyphenyl transferase CofH [Alphaproteobacteria bacterium]|nr:5-amino-6-(D-ribitylamino)uracil--L-tyrosine 4-hydroxyphenyl transferase CofH [Alphaproteobacteria bacterium]
MDPLHYIDRRPEPDEALALADYDALEALMGAAARLRDWLHGPRVSYSRKVFIPLTHLCRDVCHYCTFAKPPRRGEPAYMTPERVLEVARAGAAAGCKEALFTLGDKPERRYRAARAVLAGFGYRTTLDYLKAMAQLVFDETGLLPHLNPGLATVEELAGLRRVSASMGIMLESASDRLCAKGMPHYGSPDKQPARRLETIRLAAAAKVPFTSGILIGIGETRRERIEALLALREIDDATGAVQEIIVQNFRAKPGTKMAAAPEPELEELLWTIAVARLVFGPAASIQAPPNLSPGALGPILAAGINDWGGVSPVTPDFVNPEAPWPHLETLAHETAAAGKQLVERLTAYPRYLDEEWLAPAMLTRALQLCDADGLARPDDWSPGALTPPAPIPRRGGTGADVSALLTEAEAGAALGEADIIRLFQARDEEFHAVAEAADRMRARLVGDEVTYVVNRNINYTNVCYFKCQFCAFSKGRLSENLRGRPYDLHLGEIRRRVAEAWERGATEVCMQGGIHPDYTGRTYLDILDAVKAAAPDIHVHAFTPLEVFQGAHTLGVSVEAFLRDLKAAGLGTLPGTAAEVLDDEVRRIICPDKIDTQQWLDVMETAHGLGIRSTATIMYGHVERPVHWARHLLRLRALQQRTGGFTEFVPLPFVHMEAPIYLKGRARRGPTFREAVLMHAVARLVLAPHFVNIQTSWVKMGPEGVAAALGAGANDLGGTLMNESITRAAGTVHGQEMEPHRMEETIHAAGRQPAQRMTDYSRPPERQVLRSRQAAPLAEIVETPTRKYEHAAPRSLYRPGLSAAG